MKIYLSYPSTPSASAIISSWLPQLEREGHSFILRCQGSLDFDPEVDPKAGVDCLIFMLADCRASVMFEVGVAIGARKPVLLLAQPGVELPVDFSHFRLIPLDPQYHMGYSELLDWLEETTTKLAKSPLESPDDFRSVLKTYTESPDAFERLSPSGFQNAIGELFKSLGARLTDVRDPRDTGVDFDVSNFEGANRILVSVKKYSANSQVSLEAAQQILGAMYALGADRVILISATAFTASAKRFASRSNGVLQLWDMNEVLRRVG